MSNDNDPVTTAQYREFKNDVDRRLTSVEGRLTSVEGRLSSLEGKVSNLRNWVLATSLSVVTITLVGMSTFTAMVVFAINNLQ